MLKAMQDKYEFKESPKATANETASAPIILNVWTRDGWLYGAPHDSIGKTVPLPRPIMNRPVKNEAEDCFRELCLFADWCEKDFGVRASLFVLHCFRDVGIRDVGIIVPETVDVASVKFAVELIENGLEVVNRYVGPF